jgi:Arc/MetJ-type ribon-helix-helix transcriptional regulator
MTIHLPQELESSIRSLVQGGRFASEDELVAQAVRAFLGHQKFLTPGLATSDALPGELGPDPLLGSMRDFADEMDEIVANAYRNRREAQWREFDLE